MIPLYSLCNILNFDLTLMGIRPTDYDVTLMFYFDILGLGPAAYKHDDLFDILRVSQLHMFYV